MNSPNIFGPYPVTYQPSPIEITLLDARLSCGFPSPAKDYEEKTLDLHTYLIRNSAATFFFTVSGDSMRDAGIHDGDRVAVDRSIPPKHGHIVVAIVNQEHTLKRLYRRRGVIELRAENPAFEPIRFDDDDELVIWGVVVAVIRKLPA